MLSLLVFYFDCFTLSFVSFVGSGSAVRKFVFVDLLRSMKCFPFTYRDKKDEPQTPKSAVSIQSSFSTFTDNEGGRNVSQLTSLNVSATSTESMTRPSFPSISQKPINLKVFTIAELKSATKNFSRSVMIGEGGFGCVFRGLIKDSDDPSQKIEIAVKKLGGRGIQARASLLL